MDEKAVRTLIGHKLHERRLPHESVTKAWAGPSDGETCDACDAKLEKSQLVMEGTTQNRRHVQFHLRCFQIWEEERRRDHERALGHTA
jgi:hypothetical protein